MTAPRVQSQTLSTAKSVAQKYDSINNDDYGKLK